MPVNLKASAGEADLRIAPWCAMDWDALDLLKYRDEAEAIGALLAAPPLTPEQQITVRAEAEALVSDVRRAGGRQGVVESFLKEFSLGTREGLALMCLAEALLRIPDDATRDALISEKIGSADWASHLGQSDSLFVNASTWGLMLTGRLVDIGEDARQDAAGYIRRLAGRIGEPVIRAAVAQAIRIMGEQFVLGRTIEAALKRAKAVGQICSFDMLGEGARDTAAAQRHETAYADAIERVGRASAGAGPEAAHGVSVKLSALSPRYEATQEARVWSELYPRLKRLALIAARHDINFTIDAEEADRLVLSLKLLDRLAHDADLGAWRGLGLAVQAYQKRAPQVIGRLAELAQSSGRRLMVRLVKGAYWDTEIKRAQIAGQPSYPVYTTKSATDLSYLVAAKALIEAAPRLYAQFATHNAHSLAAVRWMAESRGVKIEHQRLHGMGEALYAAAVDRFGSVQPRVYAPVGEHEDLLPYLVRRLLENGANTSFVHTLLDETASVGAVVVDPLSPPEALSPHPRIPVPSRLFDDRLNSAGLDLSIAQNRRRLVEAVAAFQPLEGEGEAVRSPVERAVIGHARDASPAEIDHAFAAARAAQPAWDAMGGGGRAPILRAMADALEDNRERLISICVREAGKTLRDAVDEVREAVDFCRYYALLAERQFAGPRDLVGPAGETNTLELHGRGVFACISPWNFPLAIFIGQVAAALAAGNAVLAKPAEQTPLIAAEAVKLFHGAGLDPRLLHLIVGPGETVGARLTGHPELDGVAFTGGVDAAFAINRTLAARTGPILPLIAETGGLNAMVVDGTALREQVIDDVILSAFGSAGQRCSALRVLMLPKATANLIIEGLAGAMDVQTIGDPADPGADIGPVIDEAARGALEAHLAWLAEHGRVIKQSPAPGGSGVFFGPVLAEISSVKLLQKEVFGPVLHVVRYDPADLGSEMRALAAKRYGLTLGVHSRIEAFVARVRRLIPAGNVYVNRSMIGAVVGVQPFGGEGLSGTGPKAGGPHALLRFALERSCSVNIAAQGGDPKLLNL